MSISESNIFRAATVSGAPWQSQTGMSSERASLHGTRQAPVRHARSLRRFARSSWGCGCVRWRGWRGRGGPGRKWVGYVRRDPRGLCACSIFFCGCGRGRCTPKSNSDPRGSNPGAGLMHQGSWGGAVAPGGGVDAREGALIARLSWQIRGRGRRFISSSGRPERRGREVG